MSTKKKVKTVRVKSENGVGRPTMNNSRIQRTVKIDEVFNIPMKDLLKSKQKDFPIKLGISDVINAGLSMVMSVNNIQVEGETDYGRFLD